MEPALSSIVIVLIQIALVLAAGIAYLRRVRVDRPPVGVFQRTGHLDRRHRAGGRAGCLPPPSNAGSRRRVRSAVGVNSLLLAHPAAGARPAAWTGLALVVLDIAIAQFFRQSSPSCS